MAQALGGGIRGLEMLDDVGAGITQPITSVTVGDGT